MGQIVSLAAKPKRCNLNQLGQVPTPAAGEYILVSSDNSMNAAGQGNFDCYVVGDGTTAATALELKNVETLIGVFDISSYHATGGVLAKYADLTAALNDGNNIPQSFRKGGMSVKFVQSSDDKYVQYRLMSDEWSTNTEDWSFYEDDVFVENFDFVSVVTDGNNRILYGVKTDGEFVFGVGVPKDIKDYVLEQKSLVDTDILAEKVRAMAVEEAKVDKIEGKSLIDSDFASSQEAIESHDYLDVVTDSESKILEGIKIDGTKYISGDLKVDGIIINENNQSQIDDKINKINNGINNEETLGFYEPIIQPEYMAVETDAEGKILGGRKADGTKFENMPFEVSASTIRNMDNPYWIEIKTDGKDKVLEGFSSDGKKYISNFDDNTKNTINGFVIGNKIEIPIFNDVFVSPVPITITGTKGDEAAKYELSLPLNDNAFNIRFKFKITENLLNQEKSAIIAKLGGANAVKVVPVPLYQNVNTVDAGGHNISEYSFHLFGGLKLNNSDVNSLTNNQNLGDYAFYVKYIGEETDVTIENTGSAMIITVNGFATTYSYTTYTTVEDLYDAIKLREDFEIEFCAIETRKCSELAIFPPCKIVTAQYRDVSGTNQNNPIEYTDAAPFFVSYAVDNTWHQVEIVKIGGNIYSSCDGNILPINPYGTTLVLGGSCGVLFKDLVVYTNSVHDAEYIDAADSLWTVSRIISSANPHILVYEGHNMLDGTSHENTSENNMGVTIDRLNIVFNYLIGHGYTPVSLQNIADYYCRLIELPKRCFVMIYDDFEFPNCIHRAYRAVHTKYGVRASLAIVSNMSETTQIKLDDNTVIDIQEAVEICKKYNFLPVSHTRNHRYCTHIKQSDYMSELIADTLDQDKKSINADIIVYPYGEVDTYMSDTLKWLGFRLGVNIVSNNPNRLGRNRYSIGRQEIGLRENIEDILLQII